MTRFLLSTTRTVHDPVAYLGAWEELRALVEELGGHAWIFEGVDGGALFMEFIEWKQAAGAAALTDMPSVRDMRGGLDQFGLALQQLWKEVEDR